MSVAGRLWRVAQAIGVAATVALLVGLVTAPDTSLTLLWSIAIPLLPASFLLAPALWRNVCPLGTLNMLTSGVAGRRIIGGRLLSAAGIVGIALLAVLVPARRFLLNTDGVALAAVIVAVAVAAIVLGAFFDMKAGFCTSICPVLPVERLYGQHPLVEISNPRCVPCTMCTMKGCLDLAPAKSIPQVLGRARRSHAWLLTSYGIFAGAFPGFVLGYYVTADSPLSAAGTIYLTIAGWALASYVLSTVLIRTLRMSAPFALMLLAAVAVGIYYWFAAPLMASALAVGGLGTQIIRGAPGLLIVLWVWRAVTRLNGNVLVNAGAAH